MFAFDRSAIAVLLPLALLLAVVLMSNRGSVSTQTAQLEARIDTGRSVDQTAADPRDQTVAANLASR